MSRIINVKLKPEHEVAYQDLCTLVNKHAQELSAVELLAIAANMVGKLIAMQDQRKLTPEQALVLVGENITIGNKQVLEKLQASKGRA